MRGKLGIPFLLLFLLGLMSSCGLDAPTSTEDLDVVVSSRDPETNFDSLNTYAMPNTIAIIQDPGQPETTITVDASLQSDILNQVAVNLQNAGYTRLADANGPKPDVIVQVSAMATTTTTVYYSSWYPTWGAYYGTWYGSAFGAGWYPYTVTSVTTATIGSLILEMTNPNSPNIPEQKIPSLWVGVLSGYLAESMPIDSTRVINGVNQAFAQSPYL